MYKVIWMPEKALKAISRDFVTRQQAIDYVLFKVTIADYVWCQTWVGEYCCGELRPATEEELGIYSIEKLEALEAETEYHIAEELDGLIFALPKP